MHARTHALAACLLVALVALAPPSVAETGFDEAFAAGREAMRARDYRGATEAFERAVAERPGEVDAWFRLGLARSALGDGDGALQAYGRVVELDPGHAKASNNIANVWFRRGRYEEAADWYEKALAIDPDYLLAIFHHGWVLRHFNRNEEAEARFARCLELPAATDRERATQLDCLFYLGALRFRAEDWARTAAIMEQVLAVRRGHVEARYFLGMAYRRQGRLEEAREQLEIHRQLLQASRKDEPVKKRNEE